MRAACAIALALLLPAASPAFAPRVDAAEALRLRAAELFRGADFDEAGALLQALAPRTPAAARDWLALLSERQGAAAVEAAASALVASTSTAALLGPSARLWLARSQACQARWEACLLSLAPLLVWEREAGVSALRPEALALRAEALDALGSTAAAEAFEAALEPAWPGRARLLLKAGDFHARHGRAEAAERLYKSCEDVDPAYAQVHVRLAALYVPLGRFKDAKTRLERALGVDAADQAAKDALNALLKAQPELATAAKAAQKAETRRFLATANPTVKALAALPGEAKVRVGLLDLAPSFKLRLGGPMRVVADPGDGVPEGLTLAAGSAYEARLSGSRWQLRPLDAEGELGPALLSFRKSLRLEPLDLSSTFGVYDIDHGAGYFWAGKEHRYYRGAAELRPKGAKGLTLVNELGMEAYLLSVVPSEIWANWPPEALKAQAIAARTDSLRKLGNEKAKGYDLCPTVQCAVYRGSGAEDPRTTAAVLATAGLVLQGPDGRLAPTFYMNNSGGHTQEPGEAWKSAGSALLMAAYDGPPQVPSRGLFPVSPASLLRFIDDAGGEVQGWAKRNGGSTWRWVMSYTRAELSALVGRRHPTGPLLAVEPLERTAGGYVRQVRFSGEAGSTLGSSDLIRSAIKGLKSNLFYVETRRDPKGLPLEFIFHGAGWGHGVGLSQAGAAGMAEAGKKAPEILAHYFGGAKPKKRYP